MRLERGRERDIGKACVPYLKPIPEKATCISPAATPRAQHLNYQTPNQAEWRNLEQSMKFMDLGRCICDHFLDPKARVCSNGFYALAIILPVSPISFLGLSLRCLMQLWEIYHPAWICDMTRRAGLFSLIPFIFFHLLKTRGKPCLLHTAGFFPLGCLGISKRFPRALSNSIHRLLHIPSRG